MGQIGPIVWNPYPKKYFFYLYKYKLGKRIADWSGKSHVTIADEPNQVINEVDLSMDVVLRVKGKQIAKTGFNLTTLKLKASLNRGQSQWENYIINH